jgi:hypothetical protein
MKIKKIVNHGIVRWRVNDPRGLNGKRQRKFFDSKEAAEGFIRQQKADRDAFGIYFTTIPPRERASMGYQLDRLHKLGWTLPAAVDFIQRNGKIPPPISLGKIAAESGGRKRKKLIGQKLARNLLKLKRKRPKPAAVG